MSEEKEVSLDVQVLEREKEGLKVGRKLADFIDRFGMVTGEGIGQYVDDSVAFTHDRLLNVVEVQHGGSYVFRANLTSKVCTVFKNGSWEIILNRALDKLAAAEKEGYTSRNIVAIRNNMGLPKS